MDIAPSDIPSWYQPEANAERKQLACFEAILRQGKSCGKLSKTLQEYVIIYYNCINKNLLLYLNAHIFIFRSLFIMSPNCGDILI
jgi:hypothetical protein